MDAAPARAQNATWLPTPADGNFNNSANWSPGAVPTGTASFGTSSQTTLANGATLGGMTFNAGAPAYTFSGAFTFTGAGIVNNSSNAPTFNNPGTFTFANASTAGNAAITTANGATTAFQNNSTGGNAQLIANTGGIVDFSATSGPLGDNRISAGSIGGGGTFRLGRNQLTVGGNNLSTTVSGAIQDGGNGGGSGASLVKTGSGTLTLSGTNTYSGGTVLNGGTLSINDDSRLGAAGGALIFNGGTLQTTNDVTTARAITLNAGGGTLELQGGQVTLNGAIAGAGSLTQIGGALIFNAANTYTGGTVVRAGYISMGAADVMPTSGAVALNGGSWALNGFNQTVGALSGTGGTIMLSGATLTTNSATDTVLASRIFGPSGALVKQGTGTLTLTATNSSYSLGTTISGGLINFAVANNFGTAPITLNGGGLQWRTGTSVDISGRLAPLGANGGTFDTNGNNVTLASALAGAGGLTKAGLGTLTLTGANTYGGGTVMNGGVLSVAADAPLGAASGGLAFGGGTLQTTTSFTTSRSTTLNAGGGTFLPSPDTTLTVNGNIGGAGGLTKAGTGTLILGGSNSYGGGTLVSGGTLQGTTSSLQGNVTNNAAVIFSQPSNGTYAGNMSGTGSVTITGGGFVTMSGSNSYTGGTLLGGGTTLQVTTASLQGNITNNATVAFSQAFSGTYAGNMSGTGSVSIAGGGVITFSGANTYTGPTSVTGSGFVVNGSLASAVTLDGASFIGGNGTIGGLTLNGSTLSPGNSIGLLTVNGSLVQRGGTYIVEANAQGQSDRVTVNGAAALDGGTVQLVAAPGSYGTSTTYTILSATGGVSGAYSNVTSNFAFLTPSLDYTANSVLLTLALQGNTPFSGFGGNTANQRAVGRALDQSWAGAGGDFATVVGALANLNTQQAGPALTAISGQPYADTGTATVGASLLFLNTLGQQVAVARGKGSPGTRVALAEACNVACDDNAPTRLSAWMSGVGGFGHVGGTADAGAVTYNLGGAAAGIDYRLDPRFLMGLAVSYASGRQWVGGFNGSSNSDNYSAALYASFTQSGFYADALAGYAYADTRTQRAMVIPGLQSRLANGSTGTNQFLGQVEGGYGIGIYAPAQAMLTPFARLQTVAAAQNGFTESGSANALGLIVAPQDTTSVRTVLGADLAGTVPLGAANPLAVALRLGWAHEYASTVRPVSASFQGAPSASFTVYGAQPMRDAVVIGLGLETKLAAATSLYARYDGEISGGNNAHAVTAGLRISW